MPLRNLIIVAIAVLVSLACYTVAAKNRYANLFAEAMDVIDKEALRIVPSEQLFISAMDGMMEQLDEHSAFIAGERFQEFDEDIRQQFGGVGMYVETNPENKRLFVLSPMPGTPAFEAGLLIGDEIIEINGTNVVGLERAEAVKLLRGPINEAVELTVERNGQSLQKKIIRAAISVPSVNGDFRNADGSWQFVLKDNPRIGYVRISQFGEKTASELRDVLTTSQGKIDGLILDLRNNPGGLLGVAVEVCDFFLDKGAVIVSIRGRGGELAREPSRARTEPLINPGLPIVVLVNRYSASASEIVAGCLQDHERAVIVGEQSWGKGTVQDVIPMQRGTSALKLTTASYWRPSGKHIDRHDDVAKATNTWGVQPNVGYEISLTEAELFDNMRYRSIRDIEGLISQENSEIFDSIKKMRLKMELPKVDENGQSNLTAVVPQPEDEQQNQSDAAVEDDEPEQPYVDRALQRAIEYIQDVALKQQIAA